MGDVRPWHIVVIVAALAIAGVSLWFTLNRGPNLKIADSMLMVDVQTGELFQVSRKPRPPTIPFTNPKTKAMALLPVEKSGEGGWKIMARYMENIDALNPSTDVLVNRETGEVKVSNTKPKPGR